MRWVRRPTYLDEHLDDEQREQIETQARILYGLIHARYIITTRGLAKMAEKYKRADFGRCPRVLCYQQPLLPVGLSDIPFQSPVKLHCPRCEDLYSPKSSRHGSIDGAFFGTTFAHMLLMVYPQLVPVKAAGIPSTTPTSQLAAKQVYGGISAEVLHQRALAIEQTNSLTNQRKDDAKESASHAPSDARPLPHENEALANPADPPPTRPNVERVVPRIFGFPVHETSQLLAWQESQQQKQVRKYNQFQYRMAELKKASS